MRLAAYDCDMCEWLREWWGAGAGAWVTLRGRETSAAPRYLWDGEKDVTRRAVGERAIVLLEADEVGYCGDLPGFVLQEDASNERDWVREKRWSCHV